MPHIFLTTLLLLSLAFHATPARAELPERHRMWLAEVAVLITDDERATFVALSQDYQRDAFVEAFWKQRDPYPDTARNELREEWKSRLAQARQHFDSPDDARAMFLLLNGWPLERDPLHCRGATQPLEVWLYDGTDRTRQAFAVIFFRRWGQGAWRRWEPFDGLPKLFEEQAIAFDIPALLRQVQLVISGRGNFVLDQPPGCDLDPLLTGLELIFAAQSQGGLVYEQLLARLEAPLTPPSAEWVDTFRSYATDVPADTDTFDATLSFSFPGWQQQRTIAQGIVTVSPQHLGQASLAGHPTYNLVLNGEILNGDTLFERFRYRFDFSATEVGSDPLPLVFQRYLRPGSYRVVLRLEDPNGERFSRIDQTLDVPRVDRQAQLSRQSPEVERALEEANRVIAGGEASIKLVMPFGDLLTGLLRFDTLVIGDRIDRVTFAVDDRPILTKREPPYSVELDFGRLPQSQTLRVTAFAADGSELASDERLLNGSPHRFAVRLIEPISGAEHAHSLRARVDVTVPEGESLDRVEIFRDETRVATLYQPPFVQPVTLPDPGALTLVRALGHLRDGTTTEDVAIVNGPDNLEQIDVDFVELYTAVLDRGRRPVLGLDVADFTVLEDGAPQTVQRFEVVRDLPIHATILLDVSASMAPRLAAAREAAVQFFTSTVSPGGQDRVAAIAFNDRPRVVASFGNDIKRFAEGIAGVKAERGTSFFDSLIYALFYANGLQGQRAILLLSDGVDENSRFDLDDTLEYARRAEVTLYAIGLDLPRSGKGADRRVMSRLAEETGGRSFFLDNVSELAGVYDTIREELRSRYLLAYQSNSQENRSRFRRVEVKVKGKGEAKTIRGYYP